MDEADTLIDRIYEAAALPDLWPSLLAEIARYGGGHDALIFTVADGRQSNITSPNLGRHLDDFAAGRWAERSDRPARIVAARHHGFITDLDVYSMEEIETSPVYQEWLIPRGWGWGIGTAIPVPSGEQLFFTVERAWARGPAGRDEVARMDALRPHLARAALVSARLHMDRARAATQALELIGLPAGILDAQGRTLAMNATCEAFVGRTVRDGARFALVDPVAQRLLEAALAEIGREGADISRSVAVGATEESPACVLHVLPVRRRARDLFSASSALLVFTPLGRRSAPAAELLGGLFDLTPAEARVASAVARLGTVGEIAKAFGSAPETVRTQLKSVFAKTGTHRQAELTALLAGLVLPGT